MFRWDKKENYPFLFSLLPLLIWSSDIQPRLTAIFFENRHLILSKLDKILVHWSTDMKICNMFVAKYVIFPHVCLYHVLVSCYAPNFH